MTWLPGYRCVLIDSPSRRVGLLYHPHIEESRALARALARIVDEWGYEPWMESAWARDEIIREGNDTALLVTLGGDGTILRVARAVLAGEPDNNGRRLTPLLLTVDFGTLGFLTELKPGGAAEGLRRVLDGGFWVEERALLRATLTRGGMVVEEQDGLNDVVLARADGPHAIRLTLFIDGTETARYTADALIVASPTGSTAYALGAGGPIMGPEVKGMLVIPVAPHLAVARGFVVPATSTVTLQASVWKQTIVTIDGQINISYGEGDLVTVTQSDAVARFVRIGPRNYFYATLQEKLRRGA